VQIFAFGSVFILLRALTLAQFGVWAIFLAIASVIEVGRIGLLQNALVKFLSTAEEDSYAKISTASLALNLILTSVIVVFLLSLAGPISLLMNSPELAPLLRIYALTNIALLLFFQFNYIQQANLDFRGIFWANFVRQGLFFIFVLYLFISNATFTLQQLAVLQIFAALAGSFTAYLFCRKFLSFSGKVDKGWINKLFGFGIFVFGTNIFTMLFKSTDKLLLGAFSSITAAGVALYETAIKITNLTDVPTLSMASILFPQSARRSSQGKGAVKDLYEKAVGAILSLMVPAIIFVLIFAYYIIIIVASEKYVGSVEILRITILYGLFIPYAVQFGTVLDSIGMPRTNFLFTVFNFALLVLIDFFFIKHFGIMGAAYGTLLTYILTTIIMQYYLYKKLNVNPFKPFVYIFYFYKKGWEFGVSKIFKNKSTPEIKPKNIID